ncbi:MAG TPA: guanitoxin biosynthesis heme-dependent pre-guanitoxin N-hydroxylase GntA, partial [Chthoniobacterales bacterium]
MRGNPFAREKANPPEQACDSFAAEAESAFRQFVLGSGFPCVGAKAAFNSGSYILQTYGELGAADSTAPLSAALCDFTQSEIVHTSEYATFVAIFEGPRETGEVEFEKLFWQQLRALHELDAAHFDWDPNVRSDPADPLFSFSLGGQALYVIGLHANSSREARRFPWPALVFNPHEQFERLRADGKWKRMQKTIRARDLELQGSINPMLSDFGQESEARQYSGRAVEEDWR